MPHGNNPFDTSILGRTHAAVDEGPPPTPRRARGISRELASAEPPLQVLGSHQISLSTTPSSPPKAVFDPCRPAKP